MPYNYSNQSQSLTILTSQQKRTTIGPNTQFITLKTRLTSARKILELGRHGHDGQDWSHVEHEGVDGGPGEHGDDDGLSPDTVEGYNLADDSHR